MATKSGAKRKKEERCENAERQPISGDRAKPHRHAEGGTHAVDAAAFAELTVASRRTGTRATAHSIDELPFSYYLKF
jgi:hypothetical protein